MSEVGAGMHRGGDSPAAPVCDSLPDDLLLEILVRLPPEPSSLPRASAVRKRWRRLVADPKFLPLFCAHHRKPPMLGVFEYLDLEIVFSPLLDPPDRIPRERFSLGSFSSHGRVLDVRHGRVLVNTGPNITVCDPITSQRDRITIPPEILRGYINGALLCAAGDQDHVHGVCHLSPFKVVLVSMCGNDNRAMACVYSSETGIWGNLISTEAPYQFHGAVGKQPTLVGNALYWFSMGNGILEFDMDEQSLSVIKGPPCTNDISVDNQIIHAEDGAVGFVVLSYPHLQMWQRNINGHGIATWVPWKTIEAYSILGVPPQIGFLQERLLGYDENADVLFLYLVDSVYMLQLKSMQSKKVSATSSIHNRYFPFNSFYTPGCTGGLNGAEMLHIG